jgi:hypothetical protein
VLKCAPSADEVRRLAAGGENLQGWRARHAAAASRDSPQGLLGLTGAIEDIADGYLEITAVETIVLEDTTGGRKVHAPGRVARQRFEIPAFMKGHRRRKPRKHGKDVRVQMVEKITDRGVRELHNQPARG